MSKVNTVVVFLGLKILEISGILFLPYFLGRYVTMPVLDDPYDSSVYATINAWFAGVLALAVVALVAFILVGVYAACKANWKWAKEITKRR